MAEINLAGVAHRYEVDGDYALRPMELVWEDGGAYALLGPSGCGKTTMLNIISGLVRPSEGRVLFDGVDVTDLPTEARNIAQVFQFPVLYESMTVAQNLRFPLRNRGASKAEAQTRAEEVAELLDISQLLGEQAKKLPADAKQIVSLGRGLVRNDVAAILFDEPLTVIDPQRKWELRQTLKRVHGRFGHTLVYVTHDQTEALTFADRVVVMDTGEVVQEGTPRELFEEPSHRFVGNFIGSPGMNFLDATLDDQRVRVNGVVVLRLDGAAPSGALEVGVRPEFIRLVATEQPACVPATVTWSRDIGVASLVGLQVGAQVLTARIFEPPPTPGAAMWAAFDPDHTRLFADGHAVTNVTSVGSTR
jgi:glycerol transport system ATP-binding protein